jgi:hypothetical protein
LGDLTALASRLFRDQRINVAAILLLIAAVPWLLAWHWRPMIVGIATMVTAFSLVLLPPDYCFQFWLASRL